MAVTDGARGGRDGPARRRVVAALRPGRAVGALAAWALVGAVPTLAGGQAIARAVDDGFLAGRPATGLAWLGVLGASVPVGAWGASRTYRGVARVVEPLRDDLVRLVVGGALRRSTEPGAAPDSGAVARLTQHVETAREAVAGLLLVVLAFAAALVATLIGLASLAAAIVPLVAVPLAVALVAFVAGLPEVMRRQRRALAADERLAEAAGDVAGALRDVVACGAEEVVVARLDRAVGEQVDAGRAVARAAGARSVVVALGSRAPVVVVLFAAPWLLRRGLTPGALVGALTYLVQGLGPAVSSLVTGLGAPMALLAATVDRLDAALPAGGGPPHGPAAVPASARVELRGVTFRYRAAAEPVVDGLDLAVADGEHLAVVGPSGAGKSTLAALLVGLLEPQEGTVRHGGLPPADVSAGARVLIPQQAYVFRASVGENLRYLRPDAPDDAVLDAAASVGAGPLVARLGGLAAPLDPAALSAGERQLVALARAHLSHARLVVLDEATCHLDPVAEAVAEDAFAARGGALVVVAHRISSARRADRVLVLDGRHATAGTHDDLVPRSDLYRDLVGHWDATTPDRPAPPRSPSPAGQG